MLEFELIDPSCCSLEIQGRKMSIRVSFKELSKLLLRGERLVARYFCYMTGASTDVVLRNEGQFTSWQQSEDAGVHILKGVYALKE